MSSLCFSPEGGGGWCTYAWERRVYESEQPSVMSTCCWSFSRRRLWEGGFEVAGKNSSQRGLWRRLVRKRRVAGSCWSTLVSYTVNTVSRCDASQAGAPRLCSPSPTWSKSKCPQPTGWPCAKKSPPAMHQVRVPSAGKGELFLSWKTLDNLDFFFFANWWLALCTFHLIQASMRRNRYPVFKYRWLEYAITDHWITWRAQNGQLSTGAFCLGDWADLTPTRRTAAPQTLPAKQYQGVFKVHVDRK